MHFHLVNTFKGMAIDIKKKKPIFNNVIAGLSGPAIKPIALRMVYEVCKAVNIPVVGMGGICYLAGCYRVYNGRCICSSSWNCKFY